MDSNISPTWFTDFETRQDEGFDTLYQKVKVEVVEVKEALEKHVEICEEKFIELQDCLDKQKRLATYELDKLEQYTHRENIRVSGLAKEDGEILEDVSYS